MFTEREKKIIGDIVGLYIPQYQEDEYNEEIVNEMELILQKLRFKFKVGDKVTLPACPGLEGIIVECYKSEVLLDEEDLDGLNVAHSAGSNWYRIEWNYDIKFSNENELSLELIE